MQRHAFWFSLAAAAFCLAFLGSTLAGNRAPVWDPVEPSSALFGARMKVRPVHQSTKATAMKWAAPAIDPNARFVALKPGFAAGVLASLVSYQLLTSTALNGAGSTPTLYQSVHRSRFPETPI